MYVSWRQAGSLRSFAARSFVAASVLVVSLLAVLGGGVLQPLQAAPPSATPSTPPSLPGPVSSAATGGEQRIYRGSYYQRGASTATQPLFWYERWHQELAGQQRSTHVHHELDGSVVLRQSALHSSAYELLQFESDQRQTGVRAEARVLRPGLVRLQRSVAGAAGKKAVVETVELEHRHPLVVGPTLYGTMLRHWGKLVAGQPVLVDYLSLERLDTYAFELRRVASDASTITFELAPSGFFLSLLVSPLRIVFASRSRQVLSYEGPSPVLLEQGKKLESFDARIEYTERAPLFR